MEGAPFMSSETVSLPPGPRGHFLSGNLPEFRRDRLEFLTSCARDYGDVVRLRFGSRRLYLVSHPDLIEEVLVTQSRNFIKHFALRLNPLVLGKGLLTSEGDFWLRQRRLIQPAFGKQRIAAYAPVMVSAAQEVIGSWQPGETRDIMAEMMRLTLQIAAKTLFDADTTREASNVGDALKVLQESFLARFNYLLPVPLWVPTRRNLRLRRAVRRLDNILYGFIRQRRASEVDKGDLLSLLLHARDEDDGGQMTDQQVRDEAMTLFLAGHETTALAMTWTWSLLANSSEADARLIAELRQVLSGRPPTVEDLPRLKYTEMVIQESMRLRPPAYLIGREALQACEIGGYRVPRGTTVLMSPWVLHHDKRYFDDPDRFRPERWAAGLAQRIPKFAYFPFGGGPRICIGNTFAMMETVLVLATIAPHWRFTLAPGAQVEPIPTFTLRPRHGVPAVLTPR
jgi:cytochrome P450